MKPKVAFLVDGIEELELEIGCEEELELELATEFTISVIL
jgi:hypothetical protein